MPILFGNGELLEGRFFPQHQTSTTLLGLVRENRVTLPLPRSPSALSHIHSKTACRGASACQWHASYEPTEAERRPSPSAPANSLVPRPCENRMAWGFFVPMRPWTRSINSQLMLHPVLSSHIRPQPVFTAVFPSSTQNAPGFTFFWLNRVRFCVFCPFGRAKFWGPFLFTVPICLTD